MPLFKKSFTVLRKSTFKISIQFAWNDFRIGFYWDQKEHFLDVCPVPFLTIKFSEISKSSKTYVKVPTIQFGIANKNNCLYEEAARRAFEQTNYDEEMKNIFTQITNKINTNKKF